VRDGEDERPLCSRTSQDLDESAFGTAASARAWICLEQSGPWGRVAATESHLDVDLGRSLDALATSGGARFVLIRTPGRHADQHLRGRGRPTLLLACADPARPVLLRGRLADPAALDRLDVAALVAGDVEQVRRSLAGTALVQEDAPALLVCTNGRRDLCCAVRGRPVALDTAARRSGQVWETSHTGGHRFSPTGVLLPSGQTLARLDPDLAVAALDGACSGELSAALHGPRHDRGLSSFDAPTRASVSAVRELVTEPRLNALSGAASLVGDDCWQVEVEHDDGRTWSLTARRGVLGPDRPESCVKPPVPQVGWAVELV
jgi:hypothetical protein